ncbi:hypothetical protein FY550_08465 [Kushneria phosphatilytica]|uniref:RNA 2',3'-cyclic phosphodiesterase n=1 Tax=Kushneria phosphatilytica TaxID=657387 RepID=A0A5C0ZZ76_9GAMM|nr:hypothetical protein [Kushneria phosphatilytica]QEL11164.1 hypothetical protein FY550_08465 [Kushneria phosphatilytica]
MNIATEPGQHRLFLALLPDASTRRALLRLRSRAITFGVSEDLQGTGWIAPENWHITLAFLGACSVEERQTLSELGPGLFEDFQGVRLTTQAMQGFPEAKQPERIWAVTFAPLAGEDTEHGASPGSWREHLLSFSDIAELVQDRHEFSPHITMARSRQPMSWPQRNFAIQCHFDRIALLESINDRREGRIYQSLSVAGASL